MRGHSRSVESHNAACAMILYAITKPTFQHQVACIPFIVRINHSTYLTLNIYGQEKKFNYCGVGDFVPNVFVR